MYSPSLLKAALVFLAGSAMAHPGESHSQQPNTALGQFKGSVRRDLGACATKLSQSGLLSRNVVRRESVVAEQRRKRSIDPSTAKTRRDIITWGENPDIVNNTSHLSDAGYTPTTAESVIFANSSCALNPEGETGPYYIPGELVRSDILEDEPGVPIYLEIQLIDVATCEPIVGEYLDIWNCNSTGVYSGIMGDGNGNADDASNTKATFLRGLSPTDEDGVVTFQTLFPGHYAGRANHVHVAAHFNATLLPNNTLSGGTYDHVGQLFWDQDLVEEIEATYPYVTNTIAKTLNVDDGVFITESENTTTQSVAEYEYLGANVSEGLFAWLTLGINTTATYDPNWSYIWTANGTVSSVNGENTGSPGWSQVGDWD